MESVDKLPWRNTRYALLRPTELGDMKLQVLENAEAAAKRTAEIIAALARDRVGETARFVMAVSGGTEPWEAFRHLATLEVPWNSVHIAQVDERVAPDGDPDRNYTNLRESLIDRVPIPAENVHPMPVTAADLDAAALAYANELTGIAGRPITIDLVHLGLGTDGHTASLIPGDPVLKVCDRDVAITGEYRGHKRMTLTYSALDRARTILWLVPGERKAQALPKLVAADRSIPAGAVSQKHAILLTDRAAARDLKSTP
jgi:6-phosphogluconolactonase